MDLIPKAKKGLISYFNIIKSDPYFLLTLKYMKFTFYLSPVILLFTLIAIRRRRVNIEKEAFKSLGLFQILKNDKNKNANRIFNEALDLSHVSNKKNIDLFYKFQNRRMSYTNPSGIHNYATNCYMNSLLQCLASSNEFIGLLKKINILNELQKEKFDSKKLEDDNFLNLLLNNLEHVNHQDRILYPKELVRLINKTFKFDYDQQDSYELYHRILDLLDSFIENYRSEQQYQKIEHHERNSNFKNPFIVKIKNEIECQVCKNNITNTQNINDLSLDGLISPAFANNFGIFGGPKLYSIEEKIKNYSRAELINDYECMNCNMRHLIDNLKSLKKRFSLSNQIIADKIASLISHLENLDKKIINEIHDLKKYITCYCTDEKNDITEILPHLDFKKIRTTVAKRQVVEKYPELLVIHIQKILHYDQDYGAAMSRNKINFPLMLKLEENGNVINYELYSFLQHIGSSEFGHYISFKKYSKEKWVLINDSNCLSINLDKLKEADPYMLFYRKMLN